jgi:hypothetical protein
MRGTESSAVTAGAIRSLTCGSRPTYQPPTTTAEDPAADAGEWGWKWNGICLLVLGHCSLSCQFNLRPGDTRERCVLYRAIGILVPCACNGRTSSALDRGLFPPTVHQKLNSTK